ncbi:transaldolase family protein [Thermotoga neapolitana]|nr:transaldolase family protein [Thermotoga neapolitana]KFZ21334.1 Fructose-6-phosphate aldolase [Thermotoga neapolitana LA10]MDK2785676.1 6-deoxy-6-sulfo-D-fructose transaldolase [Thermotoga sp.]HBF10216.1 transaldolase [Thermotoga neapolitana]
MKFFLDSANLEEIKYAIKKWKIDGITTNPRHLMVAGMTVEDFAREVKELVEGTHITVSLEVNPHLEDPKEIVDQATSLASLSNNFVIKIPATESGFEALAELSSKGVKVNITLVFNLVQALQAARLGAYYISPFVGWREERGELNTDFINQIVKAVKGYGYSSQIIVAAVRSAKHFVEAALAGADIVTAGFQVYKRAFDNPYTRMGLQIFSDAWNSIYGR